MLMRRRSSKNLSTLGVCAVISTSIILSPWTVSEVRGQASGAVSGQASGQAGNPVFKLSGGISHSEKLAPMPQNERIGAHEGDTTSGGSASLPKLQQNSQQTWQQNPLQNSQQNLQQNPQQIRLRNLQQNSQAPATVIPQLNPIYARPHIDANQSIYKMRLRQLAQQNVLAVSVGRRNQKVQIKVPLWLAGQWQRAESEELSRKDLSSGKSLKPVGKQSAVVTDNFGLYKDRRGNVFMDVSLNGLGAIDRGFAIDYHQVKKYELILVGKNAAVVKVQASHRVVGKKDRRVLAAYQDEELTRYTLVRDGLVKNDSSVKVFDQMGEPKLLTHAVSVERRVKRI